MPRNSKALPGDRPPMTEAQLLTSLKTTAKEWGWLVFHNRDSIFSDVGFPDILAVKDGKLLAWELKGPRGHVTLTQQEWLDALSLVRSVDVQVVREADLEECYDVIAGQG